MNDERPRSADFVQSLERGLAVIRAFDAEHRELGLSDVARITGLTRAAARRFLLTLVRLGYMSFSDGRFSLSPRVLELGYAYLSSLSLPEVAQPHMEALVAQVNESSSISVLDDTDVVYVARVPTRRIMSITLAVGTRLLMQHRQWGMDDDLAVIRVDADPDEPSRLRPPVPMRRARRERARLSTRTRCRRAAAPRGAS